jgi:UDP-GlcNAc3NAcA epimerase
MPEEINRILTDRISGLLFCPTESAISNLNAEGIFSGINRVVVNNGDVMQDASILFSEISSRKSNILETLKLINSDYSLVTIHRAENTDDINRLTSIIKALNFINRTHKIILPVHPRTKKIINNNNLSVEFEIIPPVGYLDMLELIKNSNCIFTDSGGLQKEAYFFNKYCITLRDETEWVELIQGGYNKLVGADENMIKRAFVEFNNKLFIKQSELYGGGNASKIIRLTLENAILE